MTTTNSVQGNRDALAAPAVLLIGPPGSGKTTSLATFLPVGVDVFMLATDIRAPQALVLEAKRRNYDLSRIHWITCAPAPASWNTLANVATSLNVMTNEQLAKVAGIEKVNTNQIQGLFSNLLDFHCEHCGQHFGDPATWGADRAIVLDENTNLGHLIRTCHLGHKPNPHQGEWGTIMGFQETIIRSLCMACPCYVVVLAHVEKELDPLTSIARIMPSALGSKLAPKLGINFSEVVLQKREGSTFRWSTSETQTDVKNRYLPISDKLTPDFGQLVRAYEEDMAALGRELPTSPPPRSSGPPVPTATPAIPMGQPKQWG